MKLMDWPRSADTPNWRVCKPWHTWGISGSSARLAARLLAVQAMCGSCRCCSIWGRSWRRRRCCQATPAQSRSPTVGCAPGHPRRRQRRACLQTVCPNRYLRSQPGDTAPDILQSRISRCSACCRTLRLQDLQVPGPKARQQAGALASMLASIILSGHCNTHTSSHTL